MMHRLAVTNVTLAFTRVSLYTVALNQHRFPILAWALQECLNSPNLKIADGRPSIRRRYGGYEPTQGAGAF
jgi:hypothetical protein